jgi:hypothetical protein
MNVLAVAAPTGETDLAGMFVQVEIAAGEQHLQAFGAWYQWNENGGASQRLGTQA